MNFTKEPVQDEVIILIFSYLVIGLVGFVYKIVQQSKKTDIYFDDFIFVCFFCVFFWPAIILGWFCDKVIIKKKK